MNDITLKTLGDYRDLCELLYGTDSKSVKFFDEKIKSDRHGVDARVLADETQMMMLIVSMEEKSRHA